MTMADGQGRACADEKLVLWLDLSTKLELERMESSDAGRRMLPSDKRFIPGDEDLDSAMLSTGAGAEA
jgi:hypothetical protein